MIQADAVATGPSATAVGRGGARRSVWSWYANRRAGVVRTGRNQLWVADLTCVRLERAFVFLAVVIDVFSRKAIG